MTPFQIMWAHVDECDVCSHAAKGVCAEGERLLQEAIEQTAEAMAPVPTERAKA